MFHSEIKERFILEYSASVNTKATLRWIFEAAEVFECRFNADIAQMEESPLQALMDEICGISSRSGETVFYLVQEYIRWCRRNRIFPSISDAIMKVRVGSVEKIRRYMVANPAHLLITLDAIFPNVDTNSIEYTYRSHLWMAFSGLLDHESIRVSHNYVDFGAMCIRCPWREEPYPIYQESLNDLRQACTLTEFIEPRGANGVIKKRADGHLVVRGKVTRKTMEEYLRSTLRQSLVHAANVLQDAYRENQSDIPRLISYNISYRRVWLSGVFFRAYHYEQMGGDPDEIFTSIVRYQMASKGENHYTLGAKRTMQKIFYSNIIHFRKDYISWKSAFIV